MLYQAAGHCIGLCGDRPIAAGTPVVVAVKSAGAKWFHRRRVVGACTALQQGRLRSTGTQYQENNYVTLVV